MNLQINDDYRDYQIELNLEEQKQNILNLAKELYSDLS